MSAAPLRHSEIRATSNQPAGRTRTSARRSDPLASGTQPFTAEATELSEIARGCRFSSWAFMLVAHEIDAKVGYPTYEGSDRMADAVCIQRAASLLDCLAQDAELLKVARHLAAGGSIIYGPSLVVVGEEEHDAATPDHKLGVLARFTRRLGRLPAR